MGMYESKGVTSMCKFQASDNGVCVLVAVLGKLDEVSRGRAFSRRGKHDMDLKYVLGPVITQTCGTFMHRRPKVARTTEFQAA